MTTMEKSRLYQFEWRAQARSRGFEAPDHLRGHCYPAYAFMPLGIH